MASPDCRALIESLVGFDTVSAKSNLALIAFLQDRLAEHGVAARLVHDESGGKANLYATIGPEDRPGVLLSGHSDVVPVDGQDWSSDPFAVREAGGRLYGRGTADMKSFLAVAFAYLPAMVAADLKTPIHLAVSYDEEVGCLGVRRLIEVLNGLAVKPAMCVIGEPTGMKVVVGHKGKQAYRVRVSGLECHSSLAPQGVNAVDYAAELVVFLRHLARRQREGGGHDSDYNVPFTTIHTGRIVGGTALNIVPKDCRFEFEIRNLPEDDPEPLMDELRRFARDELEPEMRRVSAASGIAIEPLAGYPGLDTDPDEAVVSFVKALAGANEHGKISFGTEGGLFQRTAGIPTVVCGPGEIAQAHKPDEWISLDQVARCERFMERLIERLSG
jgi:acetylornithine deacetylase